MTSWSEQDSATYLDLRDVAVPRRAEMVGALVAAVPFVVTDRFRILDIGCGDGSLAVHLLDMFGAATMVALDGSEAMRRAAADRLAPFGSRAVVAKFDLASLDWWDRLNGVDLVVASMCLHHLNHAKKQYLYKAVSDRIAPGGALLVADLIELQHASTIRLSAEAWDDAAKARAEADGRPDAFDRFVTGGWNHFRTPDAADQPAALLHQLVWLKHAGFSVVDCWWMFAGHAVFGGFKQPPASASGPPLPADS